MHRVQFDIAAIEIRNVPAPRQLHDLADSSHAVSGPQQIESGPNGAYIRLILVNGPGKRGHTC